MIADFGGGTSDFSLINLRPGRLDSGEMCNLVLGNDGVGVARCLEQSKPALSEKPSTGFRFGERAINIEAELSIDQFEAWIEPEVERINSCIGRLLRQCGVAPKDIDAIYMTGGSSFVPAIRRLFERTFVGVPIRTGQEFTSVAEGLALYAAELYG